MMRSREEQIEELRISLYPDCATDAGSIVGEAEARVRYEIVAYLRRAAEKSAAFPGQGNALAWAQAWRTVADIIERASGPLEIQEES